MSTRIVCKKLVSCAQGRAWQYEIADKWDIEFALNNYLLEPFLPLGVIRETVDKLMQINPGFGRAQSEPLLISQDGKCGLVLSYEARKAALTERRILNLQSREPLV